MPLALELHAVGECHAVVARVGLLRCFHESHLAAAVIGHKRHIAAAAAATYAGEAVDAETGDGGYLIVIARVLAWIAVGAHLYLAVRHTGSR